MRMGVDAEVEERRHHGGATEDERRRQPKAGTVLEHCWIRERLICFVVVGFLGESSSTPISDE